MLIKSSWIGGIQDRDRRLQKRESRSSSFNMMNPMQFVSINTEVQLSLEKRFYSCNLPNGAHLTFKSIPGNFIEFWLIGKRINRFIKL